MRRISLQRRMIAASAVLALLVGGVFIALILALADLREARADEARSKDVTPEALGLERQVLEVDSASAPTSLPAARSSSSATTSRGASWRRKSTSFAELTSRESQASERTGVLFERFQRYRTDYLDLVTSLAEEASVRHNWRAGMRARATSRDPECVRKLSRCGGRPGR